MRGNLVAKRATLSASGTLEDGTHVDIKFHSKTLEALENLFHLHLLQLPPLPPISTSNVSDVLQLLSPREGSVVAYNRGRVSVKQVEIREPKTHFDIQFLLKQGKVYLIKEIQDTQKCEYCGDFFKTSHTCSVRRRDFYFHHVHHKSSDWWENIPFQPLGSYRETERLYITYDVETYTWHGKHGKQLVPFLLVFHISGEPHLVKVAESVAQDLNWCPWTEKHTFYYLNPQKSAVGKMFKSFRDELQSRVTQDLWKTFLSQNPHLVETAARLNLGSVDDITPEVLKKEKIGGEPRFIEVYVIGHNISGFDEIVLAAQVICHQSKTIKAFKISRNFMPRNGKILFNDITFGLPNPLFEKRKEFQEWERGSMAVQDMKQQFVKLMVRDTLMLTHTSLRNAAKAYDLPVEKGCCPYEAVNEFYRTGTYQKDEDGFPSLRYWKDQEEYALNKELWREKKCGAYDLISSTLTYCAQDVLVTSSLVRKLQESYQSFIANEVNLPDSSFNIFQRPTISSNSHAIFKQILYRAEKPERQHLGEVLLAPSNEMYDYVRQSIRGGRCYPTYIGILHEPIYVYDICGMYASALTHPMPSGSPLNPFERALAVAVWEDQLKSVGQKMDYFDEKLLPGIFTIDADPPDESFLDVLPPFCSRKGGRLCWTNEPLRGEVATSVDVITLHNRGWRVRLVPDERTTIFPEWKCLAKEYVQLNIAAKEKADREKNQTMRSIAKLLSNALYGSFATRLDNKKIVFSDQLEEESSKNISRGKYSVKSSSFIETDNFSADIMPEFVVAYPPVADVSNEDNEVAEEATPFIGKSDHVTYKYKPITFLDVEDDDVCLHTLESSSSLVLNNRYASHLASFVLAWARVFVSEWSEFLYENDRGVPMEERQIKSVYGDTDSLFVTEEGHRLMKEKGKHRIKKNGGSLVFDPQHPQVTWLVECETRCDKCGEDAYSPTSVFLAPKLYALKSTVCSVCGYVGKGKLRAKGHATSELSFDVLQRCYLEDLQLGSEKFKTSRLSLKRTLASCQSNAAPFTVTEATLTRTLRPWKDKTLTQIDQNRLIPYSTSRPNPRNTDLCWMTLPWDS